MISIYIIVKPGASRNEISMDPEGKILVKIKERPIKGAANTYLLKFLALEFNLGKSDVILEKGKTGPYKKIKVNTDQHTLEKILERYKK